MVYLISSFFIILFIIASSILMIKITCIPDIANK